MEDLNLTRNEKPHQMENQLVLSAVLIEIYEKE